MVTIYRANGFRVVIFVDDHEPAHVHVFGDGEAKVNLRPDQEPELVYAVNMTSSEVRKALRLVREQRTVLLLRWIEIHG